MYPNFVTISLFLKRLKHKGTTKQTDRQTFSFWILIKNTWSQKAPYLSYQLTLSTDSYQLKKCIKAYIQKLCMKLLQTGFRSWYTIFLCVCIFFLIILQLRLSIIKIGRKSIMNDFYSVVNWKHWPFFSLHWIQK